jgi:hypothetical protein
MDTPTPPPRRGRPPTGQTPVRTVRIGAVWDQAHAVAKDRKESLAEVIAAALHRYVARYGSEPR